MQELLVRCTDLNGVVCVTDTVAFGAMRALREAGRHVGQDVGPGVGDKSDGTGAGNGENKSCPDLQIEENGESGPVRQVTLGYLVELPPIKGVVVS